MLTTTLFELFTLSHLEIETNKHGGIGIQMSSLLNVAMEIIMLGLKSRILRSRPV